MYRFWQTVAAAIWMLAQLGGHLGALAVVVLTLLITVEVLGRSILRSSTLVADEIGGYLVVFIAFLGLGFTLYEHGHIQVDLVTSRLPSKWRRWLDVFAAFMLVGFCGFLLYHSWDLVISSYESKVISPTTLRLPLYLPQLLMVIGLGILLLAGIVYAIRVLSLAMKQEGQRHGRGAQRQITAEGRKGWTLQGQ